MYAAASTGKNCTNKLNIKHSRSFLVECLPSLWSSCLVAIVWNYCCLETRLTVILDSDQPWLQHKDLIHPEESLFQAGRQLLKCTLLTRRFTPESLKVAYIDNCRRVLIMHRIYDWLCLIWQISGLQLLEKILLYIYSFPFVTPIFSGTT